MSASRSNSSALSNNVGRAPSTQNQDKAAITLFNYFLVEVLGSVSIDDMNTDDLEEDAENILTGYSLYLRDTNIPKNHQACLADPNKEPTGFLMYTGLTQYLSKAINLVRKLVPDSEFLKDEDAVADISGAKFKKGCHRSQQGKDDSFGQETKIGLYRTARHGKSQFTPHWTTRTNCEEICKNMIRATKCNDIYNRLTEKRLVLLITKHAVGRGGEAKYLNIKNFKYDTLCDCLDTLWIEAKTLTLYSCPFVPNKEGYATCILHALGCYFACGKGLFRTPDENGKICPYLIPHIASMAGSNVARWLTSAIREYLPDEVPKTERKSVSSVSLRIGGITEMGVGNVGFFHSHARSGHKIGTNQDNYYDRDDIQSSLAAAKCLAGWTDYYGDVTMPTLRCLDLADSIINQLIGSLIMNSFDEFKPEGCLWPILLACVASLIMYDRDVRTDMGPTNAISLALREAIKSASIIDSRATSNDPSDILNLWGGIIRADFEHNNPDFQTLTNACNSTQVVTALNQISTAFSSLQRDNIELNRNVQHLSTLVEMERRVSEVERRVMEAERRENAELRSEVSALVASNQALGKQINKISDWMRIPLSPPLSAGNRSHENSTEVSVPGMGTPGEAAQITEVAAHPGASEVAQLPLLPNLPPQMPLAGASAILPHVPASHFLVRDYNSVDADQAHGGTQIEDIITSAYGTKGFKSGVSFLELLLPFRFKDKPKFKHCLELFDAVATDEQCEILGTPNLDKTSLEGVANAIADACMDQLDKWEGNSGRGRKRKGYSGVGMRVSALKTKFQHDYGSKSLKNALALP